jgi:hypothetical protein
VQELIPHSQILVEPQCLAPEFCAEVIRRFQADDRKGPGQVTLGTGTVVDPKVKDSIDLAISSLPEWKDVDEAFYSTLTPRIHGLMAEHMRLVSWNLEDTGYQLQWTKPGAIGYVRHIDYIPGRMLSFIFYLNDVDEGETAFPLHGIAIRPETGKLLLFPPYWTHPHAGLSPRNDKYIATGFIRIKA